LRKQLLVRGSKRSQAAASLQDVMTQRFERYSWMLPPLTVAFGVRIVLLVAAQIAVRLIPGQSGNGLFTIWRRFDVNWYLSIVENGYQYPGFPKSNVNFFPLYPITIWIGQHIFSLILGVRSELLVGMGISLPAFAIACIRHCLHSPLPV
jgi:Gpi18-like mannosyltransferase